ncbi:MAG: 16S rRNA (guanine(966)-N(2))-methyltransferase RsmD [Rhodocyclaceae bacterium]|nr:16S rRNA (guanine(966)-N(2))-methyltransferase RsmD [Rhodocyclaceae bacterium]
MSRVRIVGGQWRSRLLPVASVPGLRPTPDRVRETVFNWLGQDLSGWRVLDLFAGSGVLGFEAASRGAASVLMVEQDPRAIRSLACSAKTLSASCVEMYRGDALKFASACERSFDLVFVDPPYGKGLVDRIAGHLDRLLVADGWLYVEAERPLVDLGTWTTVRSGRAGQVYFQLLRGAPG